MVHTALLVHTVTRNLVKMHVNSRAHRPAVGFIWRARSSSVQLHTVYMHYTYAVPNLAAARRET
jgi:hypothetical protein